MPIVVVNLVDGRSDAQIDTLIGSVTDAVMAALDVPATSVRVLVNEVRPQHWGVGGVSKLEEANRGSSS
jgi:4-oxalocrotonate tautomerase